MNKSVYLYELDSVRNSKEEIQYAQERMFQEIIPVSYTHLDVYKRQFHYYRRECCAVLS